MVERHAPWAGQADKPEGEAGDQRLLGEQHHHGGVPNTVGDPRERGVV